MIPTGLGAGSQFEFGATTARTIHAQTTASASRLEFQRDGRPRMLFIGDSFVWGGIPSVRASPTSCEAALPAIRSSMPASPATHRSEYLLLQRIWTVIEPSV